ncbi:MAG: 3-phosphoshikimate 1-carboxyvinyltransferase [Candidatus Omnitrophica bacterium 4484_70.2]|nr:MAG: 3-phosphoshikimate 1-carboxyvinyltransferase [Candidatus Omnitrophica bacterium 4484_70.2]
MYEIKPLVKVRKKIFIPADKSISHRALIISSLAKGKTRIVNFLISEDTLTTLECLKKIGAGIKFNKKKKEVVIDSGGLFFKQRNKICLNARQSATTMRILSGVLVGQKFPVYFDAEESLRRRPMKRIIYPLSCMGAKITGRKMKGEEYPPLEIFPVRTLKGIRYKMPVASAQVKSAIIFASLYAEGKTEIEERSVSRDHTERMLKFFGAKIKKKKGIIICQKSLLVTPGQIFIPADISSASFFVALATLIENSKIEIKNVGINPTRLGFVNILKKMGAKIKILNKKNYFEPYADIVVESSRLKGIKIEENEIPLMIDEIPLLFVCCAFAKGETEILGLKELKIKETDRIYSMVYNLKRAGVDIEALEYGNNWKVKIKGIKRIKPVLFKSFSDHRTAMSLVIFGLAAGERFYIDDISCINKSFPEFISLVESLK